MYVILKDVLEFQSINLQTSILNNKIFRMYLNLYIFKMQYYNMQYMVYMVTFNTILIDKTKKSINFNYKKNSIA